MQWWCFGLLACGLSRGVADDAIRYEKIVRTEPIALEIHVLRIDLQSPDISLQLALGPRPAPDQDGEVAIVEPLTLARDADLAWAINANPWQHPDNPLTYPSNPGEVADIIGWARSDGETRSATCVGCWEFWLDANGRAHIANVDKQPDEMANAQLGVGGFQGLLRKGERLIRESTGQRAPRAAMGLDQQGRILTWVVVDKGIPAGLPGWRDVMDHYELATLMRDLGCWDAYNLDGGGSSIMIRRDATDPDEPQWVPVNTQARLQRRPLPLLLGVRQKTTRRVKETPTP